METAIIDYGMGNLLSVQRAFEKCGSDAVIIDNPLELRDAERIVLPGVGAFPDAMDRGIKPGGFGKRDTDSWNLPWNAAPCGQGL